MNGNQNYYSLILRLKLLTAGTTLKNIRRFVMGSLYLTSKGLWDMERGLKASLSSREIIHGYYCPQLQEIRGSTIYLYSWQMVSIETKLSLLSDMWYMPDIPSIQRSIDILTLKDLQDYVIEYLSI